MQGMAAESSDSSSVLLSGQNLHPEKRLAKPHQFFPFDLFNSAGTLERGKAYGLSDDLLAELRYVRLHCMCPPFPWGQIIYRSLCLGNILQPGVEGHFAEFGIGQGGTSVFFARLAKAYGRKFLAVDSFEGLPPPDMGKDNHYFLEGDYRSVNNVDNYENFMKYKSEFHIDDTIHVIKGFFKDVEIPPEFDKFAFVHLDSDLYDSVYDSLEKIWDRVVDGGIVAIDDFFHHAQGPARAVADFFRNRCAGDEPPLLYVVPTYAVLIIKGQSAFLEAAQPQNADPSAPRRRVGKMHGPRALDGNFYSFRLVRGCRPFIAAVEESVAKVRAAAAQAEGEDEREALERTRTNAEAYLTFLKYPDSAPRSGSDIMRYLWPLEDQWDIYQGSLYGMPGEVRKTIEISINHGAR